MAAQSKQAHQQRQNPARRNSRFSASIRRTSDAMRLQQIDENKLRTQKIEQQKREQAERDRLEEEERLRRQAGDMPHPS